ncbi:MAG: sigma-70 family RNA polymerase sigma factor [Firmicutes bacterium HGW-Firmicutes-16]|nr:MAG: sigma-70 family RNA polymerase sigma factor [Firmicutes bacterium HGW-Firmicutes-16]
MLPSVIAMMVDEDDREFMTQLFLQYRRIMFSEIGKIIPDSCEAEDVLQNALIRLCDKVSLLRELDERRRICYVITTVRNQAKNQIRNRQDITISSFDDENLNLVDSVSDGTDIEQSIIIKEQLRDLSSVWSMLDETHQRLLEGKYILRKSDDELGKDLGISPSSIRMMLTRARRKALGLMRTE